MAEEFRVLRPYEFHSQLISKGKRADGRLIDEFRDIKLETDAITTANSSSLVKLGNTSLVCGCTTRLLKSTRTWNQQEVHDNEINIKVELPPICSSPTGHRTQHTEQLLTKTLRNILDDTDCLDMQSLSVRDTDLNWSVDVEVICLNYDGCLLDAALIAVLAGLKSLKLVDKHNETLEGAFKLSSVPICSSFALIGDRFICDPNMEEETVAQSVFSVTVDPLVEGGKIHLNKTGGKAINISRLTTCIQKAKERATQIHSHLMKCGLMAQGVNMDCA